jgi:transcription initiation factor TFIIE subunit beta
MATAAKLGGGGTKRALAPPSPSPSIGSTTSAAAGGMTPRKDRKATPTVYSQPALTGTGDNIVTQLSYIVQWLRNKDDPQHIDALLGYLAKPPITEEDKEAFVDALRSNASIEWIADPKLIEQTWRDGTYRHKAAIPNVRNKEQLLKHMQDKTEFVPVSVKDLKDGWDKCEAAITELEAEHRLLVSRQKKDGAARMIWSDDPSLFREIDAEFKKSWLKVDLGERDQLIEKMEANGLKIASAKPDKSALQDGDKKKKKRQTRNKGKLTNSHMEGKFKDFSHMRK